MTKIEAIDAELKELNEELDRVEGTETEVYARIVGYYRSVRNWNKGKKEEFKLRKDYLPEVGTPAAKAADAVCETASDKDSCSFNGDSAEAPIQNGFLYFYRKSCPNCPPVKNYLTSLALPFYAIDVDTPEGLEVAKNLSVLSTPTAIYMDSDGREAFRGNDVASLKKAYREAC